MSTKTFCRGIPFVPLLTLLSTCLWSKSPEIGVAQKEARVTVSIYNEAGVPDDALGQAEEEASRVFRRAGIEVQWLNCKVPAFKEEASRICREAIFPEHLHLRIVQSSHGLKGEAMGISFQTEDGRGCYADLFYKPMKDLHKTDGTDVASLLGHVAAHEIGHLLLGANSHAVAGIMHAHWTPKELTGAEGEGLIFLREESQRMRQRLLTATRPSKDGSVHTAAIIPAETGESKTKVSLSLREN